MEFFANCFKYLRRNYLIILVCLSGVFFRFYKINTFTTFLGEQGRDMIIAKNILEGRLTLLGPPTSISDVHFGPFYHYFNALFLYFFKLDPVGPAIGFALMSVLSIFLLFQIGKNLGNTVAGLISALLFTVSPLMVEYGRSMFNSHFITSFTIFSLWAISIFLKNQKTFWIFLSGLFAGISFQANFLSIGIFFGLLLLLLTERIVLKKVAILFLGFLLGILPYLVFELRHEFFNIKAFFSLLRKGGAIGGSFLNYPLKIVSNYFESIYFSVGGKFFSVSLAIFVLVLFSFYYFFRTKRKDTLFKILFSFSVLELVVVSFYPGEMLEHYLGAVYPFIFLLLGLFFQEVFKTRFKKIFCSLFFVLVFFNLKGIDFKRNQGYGMPENWRMIDVKKAGKIISEDASGDFNVAAILDGDTRAYPYRYIIETKGKKPMPVEDYPKAKTLYVVAKGDSDFVLSYPVWEIYSVLPVEVTKIWPIKKGISLFKLEKI